MPTYTIQKQMLALAVDLGATHMRVALISSQGRIIQKIKDQTPKNGHNAHVIPHKIIDMIQSIISPLKPEQIEGIGIASMGPLDYQRGGPFHSPNIPFSFVPLVAPITKQFSLPVYLLNDANAAVCGEQRFGAGKNKKNLLYITISTGIGGGAIIDGNLLLGANGNAVEIGHIIIDSTYQIPCTCKKGVGHWEGYASGRNIPRFFEIWKKMHHKKDKSTILNDAKTIFKRGRANDSLVLDFLDELNRINARAISSIIASYNPELITMGGSVVLHNGSLLLKGIRTYVDHYLKLPSLRITPLGEDIGLVGAAAVVFKHKK